MKGTIENPIVVKTGTMQVMVLVYSMSKSDGEMIQWWKQEVSPRIREAVNPGEVFCFDSGTNVFVLHREHDTGRLYFQEFHPKSVLNPKIVYLHDPVQPWYNDFMKGLESDVKDLKNSLNEMSRFFG